MHPLSITPKPNAIIMIGIASCVLVGDLMYIMRVVCNLKNYLAVIKILTQLQKKITLALLFQPFIKIALGRILWNVVDVSVGVGLLLSLTTTKKEE